MSALGYVFVFYVGFYFFRLAENHNRNKWLYGVLGIFFYFTGVFANLMYVRLFVIEEVDEYNITTISMKSFFTGFVFVFVLFHLLDFIWKKKVKL